MIYPSESQMIRISEHFSFPSRVIKITPWGNGLINHTYRITTEDGSLFLLQQINTGVYKDIDGILGNIHLVTEELNRHVFLFPDGRVKPTLSLIPLKDGSLYYRESETSAWRAYNFIDDAYCVERITGPEDVAGIALTLGQFHYLLRDFPVDGLTVVEEDFHNPARHYRDLLRVADRLDPETAASISEELEEIRSHAGLFDTFNTPEWREKLPLRVNHNDPKINNIMFDNTTRENICMVDLDTMMPGLLPYDFGDAVRSVMCTGLDRGPCTDLDSIHFKKTYYRIFKEFFLLGIKDALTEGEKESLDLGVRLILWESAARYLADYLNGNIYLKVRYPEQNLIKARLHIKVAKELDRLDGSDLLHL